MDFEIFVFNQEDEEGLIKSQGFVNRLLAHSFFFREKKSRKKRVLFPRMITRISIRNISPSIESIKNKKKRISKPKEEFQ